jgi:hypothetical protein
VLNRFRRPTIFKVCTVNLEGLCNRMAPPPYLGWRTSMPIPLESVVALLPHRVYLQAVESAFGSDIDYSMLIKLCGSDSGREETRYSPVECIGTG